MKFKVGDKVKHKEYGVGEIVYIDNTWVEPYTVNFDKVHDGLHHLGSLGTYVKVASGHGYWCDEEELELVTCEPKNLIPEIAKMLGVKIGEKFVITRKDGITTEFYFSDSGLMLRQGNLVSVEETLYAILCGDKDYKILKEPYRIKPTLTEAERVILENLPKEYKWVARNEYNTLIIYSEKPNKTYIWDITRTTKRRFELGLFNHLFQFIKWEDQEPYNIEELLKGE